MTTEQTIHSKIQPEIQFLRAFAVSLVILSHSKFSMWSGGFVGVDMFFVVSGYVIGLSLIHERQQSNSNSLKRFFQRRFFNERVNHQDVFVFEIGVLSHITITF